MRDYTFPYRYEDVVGLLDLHIRHKKPYSIDVDCPFCGDKRGKMNINLQKGVYRCNYCGDSGGMIAMYAKMYHISNQEAYSAICELLCVGETAPRFTPPIRTTVKTPEVSQELPIAPLTVRSQTYSYLFSMLRLSATHRQNLRDRGLTDEHIDRYGYKSTPAFGYTKTTALLMEMGCTVEGVPGFYVDDNGAWTMNFHPKCSGIIIPIVGIDAYTAGAQIRLDRPFNERKYLWLSSTEKNKGSGSRSPVHFVGDPADKVVYVTEGALKATIAHSLSGKSFAAVAGCRRGKSTNGP